MKKIKKVLAILSITLFISSGVSYFLTSCNNNQEIKEETPTIDILTNGPIELDIDETYTIEYKTTNYDKEVKKTISNSSIFYINNYSSSEITIKALSYGEATLTLSLENNIKDSIDVIVEQNIEENPYKDVNKEEFYKNYTRATSYKDAMYRSEYSLMSGSIKVNDQKPRVASNQPKKGSSLIHNSKTNYSNNNKTYTVVDKSGDKAFEVYFGAAYTSLEEVASYIYAYGDAPINYISSKNAKPTESPFGEYLRLNNNKFSGNTDSFPYEPVLPDISGCGGNLVYYEIDIGTTGTDCDPRYPSRIYNDGKKITRGAARLVYSRYYLNTKEAVKEEDRYVFYTYNHYNDFQEYLNYENGWGEMFGNITGGGVLSSKNKNECNPTPYVTTIREPIY